jgi:predicted ATPase
MKEGSIIMKIQAVLIDGFKNLSKVKINFDNITALVALNNFGKSNVLSAIDFGLTFIKSSIEDKAEMMSNSNLIPINRNMLGRNYRFDMEVLTTLGGQEYRIQYGYEFSWKYDEDIEPSIVDEYLKIKQEEKGQKYTQLINRDINIALYKSSETGRCSSKLKVEKTELVVNKLRAYDELYYSEIIKKLNSMRIYMEDNLDAKSFYRPDPFIRKGLEDVMIDAENLPRVIYKLKDKNPDRFNLLKDVYSQLFPDVEDIIVKQFKINDGENGKFPEDAPFVLSNSIHVLYVKDRNLNHPIDFEMMSDGAKRVFMILTKIILSRTSNVSLIAIEEPENSVHPSLFQAYIRIISQLLDDCKIIITSHSPYIISYLDPSWLHVGVNREPGIAEFFAFKKSGQKLLQQDADTFKMSMGDYLFSMLADSENTLNEYLECDANE